MQVISKQGSTSFSYCAFLKLFNYRVHRFNFQIIIFSLGLILIARQNYSLSDKLQFCINSSFTIFTIVILFNIKAQYRFLFHQFHTRMNRLENVQKILVPGDNLKKEFSFTTGLGCLSFQQRQFYEQNGYLIIRSFLKDAYIEKWKQRFLKYCNKEVSLYYFINEDFRDANCQGYLAGQEKQREGAIWIQDFQFDEVMQSFCTNPDIIPYLRSFCGQNIKSVHTMFINKPPGMGGSSRHPFHQDLAYFPFGPANKIVAAWASLQDSTKQNGSLNIIPKSHKGKFYEHVYPEWDGEVNKAYLGIREYQKMAQSRLDLEMKKGDIVFFHPLLIHGSGQNKSTGLGNLSAAISQPRSANTFQWKGQSINQQANR